LPLPLLFLSLFREKRTEKAAKRKRKAYKNQNNKGTVLSAPFYICTLSFYPVYFLLAFLSLLLLFVFLFPKRKRKEEENNNP
jgi:hypothetical protein